MQITFLTMIVKEQYKLDNFADYTLILLIILHCYLDINILTYIMKNVIYSSAMGAFRWANVLSL
jgi:hypothetical protein